MIQKVKKHSWILILLWALCLFTNPVHAQENPQRIKIEKEKAFAKAEFDEANYKVIALDKYGNPHEDVIRSYTITYSENKNVYEAKVNGSTFSEKTIKFFRKRKLATKICITHIVAEDKEGHVQELPDLCDIVLFPDCKSVTK